jgi:hypothetical protein
MAQEETTRTDKKRLDDLQSFPILTSETGTRVTRRPGAPGAALGQSVEQALYETLGWRPRLSDPDGFVAALTQSFQSEVVAGRTKWKWTPHMYTVQADLGAVTGAQASIYKRATVIRQESLPLLEGLRPLRADADEENIEASRAIVESNLIELVDELGLVGGPRVQRVDTIFQILLGDKPPNDADQVGGQLGELRESFGLRTDLVNTIVEERNLTNFLILFDYIFSLLESWNSLRRFFDRNGTDVFLGTQLVLISRDLASLVEAVNETRYALDSVYVGEADRQSLVITLGDDDETKLTIEELLAWAERFGSEEGPRLIREGGKQGVSSILPTIDELRRLLRLAWERSLQGSTNPVDGFHTARAATGFQGLVAFADMTYLHASETAGAPIITEQLDPPSGIRRTGLSTTVTIKGDNFRIESIPNIENDKESPVAFSEKASVGEQEHIKVRSIIRESSEELTVTIEIPSGATLEKRDVTVTNPDGKSFTKLRAFEVIEGPIEEPPMAMELVAIGFLDVDDNPILIESYEEIPIDEARKAPPVFRPSDDVAQIFLRFNQDIRDEDIPTEAIQVLNLTTERSLVDRFERDLKDPRVARYTRTSRFESGEYLVIVLGKQAGLNVIRSEDGRAVEETYLIPFRVEVEIG